MFTKCSPCCSSAPARPPGCAVFSMSESSWMLWLEDRWCFPFRFSFWSSFGLVWPAFLHFAKEQRRKRRRWTTLCLILPSALVSAEQLCGRTLSVFIYISY
ncbi:hypothetical protein PVAP13_6KG123800 [Panicum virgatum]|uniref:Uncharacterized protein n=1 Tax=Panicum virgatum TaxID=38727 RepID=A0A8T0RAF4_PANVG|nr:hypothetical protein PVAP13_6KG123800 [Panicum virgatum]